MTKTPKNQKRTVASFLFSDRFLVLFFFCFDCTLLFYGKTYYIALNDLASRSIASVPKEEETLNIQQLEKIATTGSWEAFEKYRVEKAQSYIQSRVQLSSGLSLYFFPETLPNESLEKEFASQTLEPGLHDLRKAYQQKNRGEANKAYRKLSSRVENYELGASSNSKDLSDEAKAFLHLYGEFIKFNTVKPVTRPSPK